MRLLRRLDIKWKDFVSNEDIRTRLKQPTVRLLLLKKKNKKIKLK